MKYWSVKFCKSIKIYLTEEARLDGNMKSTMPCLVSFASNFSPPRPFPLYQQGQGFPHPRHFPPHLVVLNYIQRHARQLHQSGAGPNVSSYWSKTYSSIFTPHNWRGEKKFFKGQSAFSSTHVRWFVMLPISLVILLWGWSGEERIGRKDGGGTKRGDMWKNTTFWYEKEVIFIRFIIKINRA